MTSVLQHICKDTGRDILGAFGRAPAATVVAPALAVLVERIVWWS
jgi:hypothetical protein